MFPHQHFIVALVPVVASIIVTDRRLPSIHLLGVVFLGSQFPDLVDKPLAHEFVLLPSGRVFMHSLPIAIPLLLGLGVYGWKTDRFRTIAVFIFAHLSHRLTDHTNALLGSNPQIPPELLWPILPPTASPVTPHWTGPGEIYLHLWTTFSIALLAVSVVVLLDSEREQLGTYRRYVTRRTYQLYGSYAPK